jgi:hypothetical protein
MTLFLLIAVVIFQLSLRYQYVVGDGTKWRIDRITGQVCVVHGDRPACDQLHRRLTRAATASLSP